jgi:hypothetical protein
MHDSTIKEYAYFNAVKQPGASLKYLILTLSTKSTPSTQAVEAIKVKATKTD